MHVGPNVKIGENTTIYQTLLFLMNPIGKNTIIWSGTTRVEKGVASSSDLYYTSNATIG
jgi:UDP-3-O-[3-hydroxymyristoyl] glucosamine N-acyltransferase